jgi:tetratricopeptide (TPR) repeat protein
MRGLICTLILFWTLMQSIFAQKNEYLQTDLTGGYTHAFRDFSKAPVYMGSGFNAGISLDYFFRNFGIGVDGGYFRNNTGNHFNNFIKERYLEFNPAILTRPAESKYLLVGPSLKFKTGQLELDFYAKAGMVQSNPAEAIFSKVFSNQSFPIFTLSGDKDKWFGAWSAGSRLIFKISESTGIQLRSNIFSTEGLNRQKYTQTYSDAYDTNGNGRIDDSEYFESRVLENDFSSYINNYNLNAGIIFQLGKSSKGEVIQMMPDFLYQADTEVNPDDIAASTPDTLNEQLSPTDQSVAADEYTTIIPDDYVATSDVTDYDELAAHFLYKAGQSYFAANDFENAVACFNKLKADPAYPMAKYMFALSLASMGNCETSFSEYRDFAKNYSGEDAGVLSTVYASHLERCKKPGLIKAHTDVSQSAPAEEKPKSLNYQYEMKAREVSEKESITVISTPDEKPVLKDAESHSFRVQFIALKKPDYRFPKLYEIGEINTEYFPARSMYRYTLGPFPDADSATSSMRRMRKMGFRDAFVAEYVNGMRINTLHHSK